MTKVKSLPLLLSISVIQNGSRKPESVYKEVLGGEVFWGNIKGPRREIRCVKSRYRERHPTVVYYRRHRGRRRLNSLTTRAT